MKKCKCGKLKKVVVKRDLNKLIDVVWNDLVVLQSQLWEDENISFEISGNYVESILKIAQKLDY